MADISSGNDDKSVGKAGSFKLFGRGPSTPSRSLSKKKSNPFSRIFSRKKSDNKQSVDENDGDSSISSEGDIGKPEEIDVPKVVTQPIIEANTQMIANTVVEFKESLSANVDNERNPDLVSKLKGLAENPKENIVEKGKEIFKQFTAQEEKASEEMLEKGKEGLKEMFKLEKTSEEMLEKSKELVIEEKKTSEEIMEKGKQGLKELVNKAVANDKLSSSSADEQPSPLSVDDPKKESNDVNIVDQPSKLVPKSQEAVVIQSHDRTEDTRNQQNVKPAEDNNCVASLAEGLQKMCASWNNTNNKND